MFRPGTLILVSLALLLPGLLAFACGGGSSAGPETQDAADVPTATVPNETPAAIIVAVDEPAATPLPGAEEPSELLEDGIYRVRDGDNPSTIALQFGITAEELMAANGITDPTSLNIGDELIIPAPSGE